MNQAEETEDSQEGDVQVWNAPDPRGGSGRSGRSPRLVFVLEI